jgi:hypothetical protein
VQRPGAPGGGGSGGALDLAVVEEDVPVRGERDRLRALPDEGSDLGQAEIAAFQEQRDPPVAQVSAGAGRVGASP